MNGQPRTSKQPVADSAHGHRRRVQARAGICVAGVLLVLSVAIPAGAERCTPTDTTSTVASSSCEGTVAATTEQDEATLSASTAVAAETEQGPAEIDASVAVDEQHTRDTPSHTSPERELSVPGTQTPQTTVTLPRVDIREPINLQASGRTTVPSITVDQRTIRTGGDHYGLPDLHIGANLFDPLADRQTRTPRRNGPAGGHPVEGTGHDVPANQLTGNVGGGPDGYLNGGQTATGTRLLSPIPAGLTPPTATRSALETGPLRGVDERSRSLVVDAPQRSRPAVTHRSSALAAGSTPLSDRVGAWMVAAAMLTIIGGGYLMIRRWSPPAVS